jgi:hypothetical protein
MNFIQFGNEAIPYVVAFAMRSYLMEYISTYTMVLFFNSDLSSSQRTRNWSLNCFAASLRALRHPYWSKSLLFLSKVASFCGRQPRGPVLCIQKFLPPCWYIFYIRNQFLHEKHFKGLKISNFVLLVKSLESPA